MNMLLGDRSAQFFLF